MSSSNPADTPSTKTTGQKQQRIFALVGNPNCGKTTLFNALTGMRQKVGNYPGVTVERKEGTCYGQHGEEFRIIDLPGAYSLNARSPDEEILRDVLLGRREDTPAPDAVIVLLDASNPERNLYLATQVLELGLPTILALNMIDVADSQKIKLDPEVIREAFGVPVIPMQANSRKGLPQLRIAMSHSDLPVSPLRIPLPDDTQELLEKFSASQGGDKNPHHNDRAALYLLDEATKKSHSNNDWESHLIAARYDAIQQICENAVQQSTQHGPSITDRLDSFLLHKVWGWVALIGIMTLIFSLIFSYAEIPMGWIDSGVTALSNTVTALMPPGDLRDLITDGIIAGVGGVVIFLPQILILFFFIGLMEDTGYMSRIAFIMDRLMAKVGLNGKSFVPLLSSYACAIPGIMATRTIENPKDRIITILVAPWASCSARLPVYLLMIAVLIPESEVPLLTKIGFMLSLYILGTLGIFAAAWVFNKTFQRKVKTVPIMELPLYKAPSAKTVLLHMWERTKIFIRRAGTIILGVSILLWAAENYPKTPGADQSTQLKNSVAGKIGHAIEPIIKPLGYDWKIGIGLVASFAAREFFVSAMAITHNVAQDGVDESDVARTLRKKMRNAKRDDGTTPVFTPLVCLSLMVFYLFAMQCISTIIIVRRETNSWRWPLFQIAFMTSTAYIAALVIYQGGQLLGFH
ncbi:MAG: ferrous iron transport protein B [Verrucomicrobiales bacterium]|nr:ferrous iron transport protein B [Verrucomicrobiales bacterium]